MLSSMVHKIPLLSLLVVIVSLPACRQLDPTLNVMSFNIRYNNPADGEHAWPNRRDRVASVIRFHKADLVGMQEVLRDQISDLEILLPQYGWVGVGRDDGKNGGEFSPIFYRKERFTVLDSGTFWLSETPEVIGSKSWDAAITRIANWVILLDLQSNQEFLHLNTHFDHRGEVARTNSAALIVARLKNLARGRPVLVSGDFNVPPTAPAYDTMTSAMDDSYIKTATAPHGPLGTFGGFEVGSTANEQRIDYVFVDSTFQVLRYAALSDQWDGSYPSDHLPVLVELSWE